MFQKSNKLTRQIFNKKTPVNFSEATNPSADRPDSPELAQFRPNINGSAIETELPVACLRCQGWVGPFGPLFGVGFDEKQSNKNKELPSFFFKWWVGLL